MRVVRDGPMVILPRPDGKVIDVFTGKGWNRHSVFEVNGDGRLRPVAGLDLSTQEFQFLKSKI